jgi:hypothetical protein
MKYACLIYTPANGPEASDAILREYKELGQDARARGVMLGAERLTDQDTATTVRVRDGKRVLSDGPFAETKEVLAGFMLIDVASLDEALDFAARIPSARDGSIEVRPVMERGG